ncbi:MAG: arylsulfatase [Verrucomicrobiota bacterium]
MRSTSLFLLSITLGLSGAAAPVLADSQLAGSKPNIVFILSDDMGWAQPGFHGSEKGLTPSLDALAAESLRLNAHYTHSVCAPTRGAFLTGRYAFRNWMDWRSEDFGKPSYLAKLGLELAKTPSGEDTRLIHAMDTSERTIAEALGEVGYFSALVGKWHAGEWLPEHLPMGQGFDHQYGHYAWGIDYYNKTIVHNAPARFAVYDWHRNQEPVKEEGYATDLIADEAVRLIEAREGEDNPLFLYVAFNAVHGPLNPPPGFTGNADEPLEIRDAMLQNLDANIGKIVSAIDEAGIKEDTLLIFANDNGPVLEEMSHPWRGTKNTTFEGGVRTPCLVRWPGKTPAGESTDEMLFVADWFSTFIALAGANPEQETSVDGLDQSEMLFAGGESLRDEIIFDVEGSVRLPTIRSGDFKLMGEMLYNIAEDPGETSDVAAQHPEVVARLSQRLAEAAAERPPLGDKPLLMDPPLPWVYGAEESENVPDWLKAAVTAVRDTQPTEWAPGETPWPQAPKGAFASKMDGGLDEQGGGGAK